MISNQSHQQQPDNSSYKELDQSKNIIKEALLSTPGLLNNIIINLEEKQHEQPIEIVEPNPMEIFQQEQQNEIANRSVNDNQQGDNQEDQKQKQDYQFQEQLSSPQEKEQQMKQNQPKKNSKKQTKVLNKMRANKTNNYKINSNRNRRTQIDDQYIQQQQPIKNEKEGDKKHLIKSSSKKSSKKPTKSQIINVQIKNIDKIKNKIDRKSKQEIESKNDKKTVSIEKAMKQCSFQIIIKQDKQILSMLSQKSNKNELSIQKQKNLKSVAFWIEIALLNDNHKKTKDKSIKQVQSKQRNNFQMQNYNEKQDQQIYDQREQVEQEGQEQNYPTNKKSNKRINLGSLSLIQIITILKNEGLIKQSLYDKFKKNHTIHDLDEFINKFTAGHLANFNYKLIPFTLLDHRRLAELIFNLFPEKYYIGQIHSENEQVFNFLVSCYDLQSEKYYKLYKNIDQLSKIDWWMELIVDNRKRIDQAFKIKNAHKKKNSQEKEIYRKNFDKELKEKKKLSKRSSNRF